MNKIDVMTAIGIVVLTASEEKCRGYFFGALHPDWENWRCPECDRPIDQTQWLNWRSGESVGCNSSACLATFNFKTGTPLERLRFDFWVFLIMVRLYQHAGLNNSKLAERLGIHHKTAKNWSDAVAAVLGPAQPPISPASKNLKKPYRELFSKWGSK